MRIFVILALSLFLVFSQSCLEQDSQSQFQLILPDTTLTGLPDLMYEIKKKRVDELKLRELEKGMDSITIRLWVNESLFRLGMIYEVSYTDQKWSARWIEYYESSNDQPWDKSHIYWHQMNFKIDSFRVQRIAVEDLSDFLKKLEAENIYRLKTSYEVEGWESGHSDGNYFYVEVATNAFYHFSSFGEPGFYEEKFRNLKTWPMFFASLMRSLRFLNTIKEADLWYVIPV